MAKCCLVWEGGSKDGPEVFSAVSEAKAKFGRSLRRCGSTNVDLAARIYLGGRVGDPGRMPDYLLRRGERGGVCIVKLAPEESLAASP